MSRAPMSVCAATQLTFAHQHEHCEEHETKHSKSFRYSLIITCQTAKTVEQCIKHLAQFAFALRRSDIRQRQIRCRETSFFDGEIGPIPLVACSFHPARMPDPSKFLTHSIRPVHNANAGLAHCHESDACNPAFPNHAIDFYASTFSATPLVVLLCTRMKSRNCG